MACQPLTQTEQTWPWCQSMSMPLHTPSWCCCPAPAWSLGPYRVPLSELLLFLLCSCPCLWVCRAFSHTLVLPQSLPMGSVLLFLNKCFPWGTSVTAAGLSWPLLWLPWSCLEVTVSIAWQPQTLLTQASLQPLPASGQLHSAKLLQEEAIVFWYFFSGIILNIVSWSLFLPSLGKVSWSTVKLWLLHEVSCCLEQVEEALNVGHCRSARGGW